MFISRSTQFVYVFLFSWVAAQEPCARLSSSLTDGTVSAELALDCLRSVPVQTETVLDQLAGLTLLTTFQSDLAYLNNSEPARLYPDVDILAGLETLQERVQSDFYSNEYDLQADVARLYASAYDGHLSYLPDIVAAFAFVRLGPSGGRYTLFSVSSDGIELPQIYAYQDRFILGASNDNAPYQPSPIVQINGRDVEAYLNEHAAMSGSYHDPDANYNLLFPDEVATNLGTVFEEFRYFNESEETVLSFANGTETRLEIRAVSNVDFAGVTDAESFFEACCTGFVTDLLSSGAGTEPATGSAATAVQTLEMDQTHTMANVERARPRIRQSDFQKRQDDPLRPGSPVVSLSDNSVIGYFSDVESDLAILAISTFQVGVSDIPNFQIAVGDFLDTARQAGRTRLVIDLRGNPGGLNYLAHDTFRQIFPTSFPYDATNYRAVPLFDFTGRVFSQYFSTVTSADFDSPLEAPSFFSGGYPFNYRQNLDENNSTFESWSDLFGPVESSSLDSFTSLIRPNLTNTFQTILPVYPLGRSPSELSRPQAFDTQNIVLLQDGGCASACAIFTEFMKSNSPGSEQVRQVVVGGRPRTGPAQGVGGVKGGQLGILLGIGQAIITALDVASLSDLREFQADLDQNAINTALVALDRAAVLAGDEDLMMGSLPAATVNFRNAIREGDESRTPLQYVYDAADCRIFYTAAMHLSPEELWRRVYDVSWGEGECVSGSTGHPSTSFGTDYGSLEIPDGARSDFGIRMSGTGGNGGVGNGETINDEDDENGASALQSPVFMVALMVVCTIFFL